MSTMHKTYDARFKALKGEDDAPGTFEAYVAIFDNVDRDGDRIKSQAFDATLKALKSSGDPLPIIFSHQWGDAMAIIGKADADDVSADRTGLKLKGQMLNMDTNPLAAQVYSLMDQRILKEFSIGFSIPAGGMTKASDGAYDITAIDLFEAGPCLKGVNPATELLEVKASVLEAAALQEAKNAADKRRKAYAEVGIPGSFEETQERLRDALSAEYPPPAGPNDWRYITVVATTPTEVVYQIETYPVAAGDDGDAMYRCAYTLEDDGSVTFGTPEAVEFTVSTVAPDDGEKSDANLLDKDAALDAALVEKAEREKATTLAQLEAKADGGNDAEADAAVVEDDAKSVDAPEATLALRDLVADTMLKASAARLDTSAERTGWLEATLADDALRARMADLADLADQA